METTEQGTGNASVEEPREKVPTGVMVGGLVAVAFGAMCGAAIGFGLVDIGCHGDCRTPRTVGTLLGTSFGALGVSIVAVLVMRALVEWRRHNPSSRPS